MFDRVAAILPANPHVLQHRSILERDLGDGELALRYAREAHGRARTDQTILNTLGFALEFAARGSSDGVKVQTYLNEAAKIFDDSIRADRSNPYGYIGKGAVARQRIEREVDPAKKAILRAELLSLIEEAYENTSESPIIASQLAAQREAGGDPGEAIRVAKEGLSKNPADERLRGLLVQLEAERNTEAALQYALEGTKFNPTSWRLQRWVARLKRKVSAPIASVRGYYEAAIRHNKSSIELLVELASYLFMNGLYEDAGPLFREAYSLPVPGQDKNRIREHWRDETGQKPKVFEGVIKTTSGASAVIVALPENFTALFWRTQKRLVELREGDRVVFRVGFSARGAIADRIERVPTKGKGQV